MDVWIATFDYQSSQKSHMFFSFENLLSNSDFEWKSPNQIDG